MSRVFALLLLIVLLTACGPAAEIEASSSPQPSVTSQSVGIEASATLSATTTTAAPSPIPKASLELFEVEIIDPLEFVSGDTKLVGRLYLPIADEPVAAVVMVHGSGRRTRDESMQIALDLAEAGIAVFRFDKRGVGDSEGRYSDVGISNSVEIFSQLAQDAIAAVSLLGERADINADQIGVVGNSQAGWIMPIAATESDEIAFAVLIVGPAVSVGEENYYSALTREDPQSTTEDELVEISARLAGYDPRGFDPREVIALMDIPAIWILGGRDASIPTRETSAIVDEIRNAGDKDFAIYEYPLGTHSLSNADTGEQYDFIHDVVIDWIYAVIN